VKITGQQMREMLVGNETLLREAIKKLVVEEHGYVVDGLPTDLFDEMIDSGIKTARGFGLRAANKLATFVLLMFEFGPEFYKHPQIYPKLMDNSVEPDARLTAVVDETPSSIWEYIQSAMHRQTWFPETREPVGE
jgi:hypothetical protein